MIAFLMLFTLLKHIETNAQVNSNSIEDTRQKDIRVYWNIPTFQCRPHKINFTVLTEKFGIIQNKKDDFQGNKIAILYHPGSFPAIIYEKGKRILRNGGVPQAGNLTEHIQAFEKAVEELIPDPGFSGNGIIDFEQWRPVYRQNFGNLTDYKTVSIALEKKKHPFWPSKWIEKEAIFRFEQAARDFMETTLMVAKFLRPNATWGYYAYPYCFNMSPNNMKRQCPKEVIAENDRTKWLFQLTDNLYPSIYLGDARMKSSDKVQMIEGRLDESLRISKQLKSNKPPAIIPYFWYKYHDTREYVTKDDLFKTFTVLASYPIKSVVLWGSSKDVNSKENCLELYQYINNTLGPLINLYF